MPNQTATDSTESVNIRLVREIYHAIKRDDHAAYRRLVASDISWEVVKGYPEGGDYAGRDAVFEGDGFFPKLYAQFDQWHAVTHEYLDAGANIIALGTYKGRVIANGNKVESSFAHIWTIRDGKLARMRQFADTVQFAIALADKTEKTVTN